LIDHLPYGGFTYAEPCCGDGRLIEHLNTLTDASAICTYYADVEPECEGAYQVDALKMVPDIPADYLITNPPWDRKFLHPFIETWLPLMPMWLLFDADWAYTKQAAPYLTRCQKIVTIGRVRWLEDSKGSGKDNACWYLFDQDHDGPTEFYGHLWSGN
jgi:hypothetical protein